MECIYVLSSSMYKERLYFYKNFFFFCIPDRSNQVHYFMAPICSTCSLFTFVCVCFIECSINYSGRLIVLLNRSPPKRWTKNNPSERSSWKLKIKKREQKHSITTIAGQIKSRLGIKTSLKCSAMLKNAVSPAINRGKLTSIVVQIHGFSYWYRRLMDPEGGVEISAETTADVGQSWTPANASVIIVSLQGESPIFQTRSITWFLCDQIITRSQKDGCELLLFIA